MNQKAHILAFMNSYSHGKSGGDMVFIETAKRLTDYKKTIVTSRLGQKLCKKNNLTADFILTSYEKNFTNILPFYIMRTIRAISKSYSIEKDDVLLGTSDFFPDVIPIFLLKHKNRGTKWIQYIFHRIPEKRFFVSVAQRISFFLIKNLADKIIVDNSLLKDELIEQGFKSEKISIIYPGIDHDFLGSIPRLSTASFDCVFMAQLRPTKGIADLLQIWKIVSRKISNVKLGIMGKGTEQMIEYIQTEIEKNNMQKSVTFLGFQEDKKAFSIIKSGKIFIFPSNEEGFGIAPLEAQGLGVPVIAWDLPVFSEIFPRGMVKAPFGTIEKFAQEVINLLESERDRKRLAIEAFENAKRFHWEKTASQLELLV